MSNPATLKRMSDRTPEERREISRRAGKASGKRRRELKSTRDMLKILMAAPLDDVMDGLICSDLSMMGVRRADQSQKMRMILSLMHVAQRGDVRAIELVLKILGEYPTDRQELTISQNDGFPEQDIRISYVDNEMNETGHEIIHCPAVPASTMQAFRKKH